jgi:hypothetical protein
MGSGDVVVVGGMNVDTLARIGGETVAGSSNPGTTITAHGGVGRNVAENLARLGSPVRMFGIVGVDDHGDQLVEHLASLGVDVLGAGPGPELVAVGREGVQPGQASEARCLRHPDRVQHDRDPVLRREGQAVRDRVHTQVAVEDQPARTLQ